MVVSGERAAADLLRRTLLAAAAVPPLFSKRSSDRESLSSAPSPWFSVLVEPAKVLVDPERERERERGRERGKEGEWVRACLGLAWLGLAWLLTCQACATLSKR